MKVDGGVNLKLSFDEFAALYRLLWKIKPELMRTHELLEGEVGQILKIRIELSNWKNKLDL